MKRITQFFEALYFTKYQGVIKKEKKEVDDFFMIITFGEMMGIENPFLFYTLDILPELMPKFHQWHQDQGISHAFFDNFPCACCC